MSRTTSSAPEPAVPARLSSAAALSLTEALGIWRARATGEGVREPVEFYRLLGERILQAGEPLVGYDVVREGLEHWPGDVRLRQLMGLALARSGAPDRGQAILAELHREGHQDGETLGLLARTHKDQWTRAATPEAGHRHLENASALYERAYRVHGLIWPGINAATTALLLDEKDRARGLAAEVRRTCLADVDRHPDDYWLHATLGETGMILGLWDEAERHYREAGRLGRVRLGDLATTRSQAHLLARHLGRERGWVDACFRFPGVVTFSGHMIDRPGRPRPRFPSQLEKPVAKEIAARLDRLDAGSGFVSAACGSDILFAEAVLARGGEIHIVLPFAPADFRETSVDVVPGGDWGARFDRVLERAAHVTVAGERGTMASGVLFEYGNLLVDGLALLRADSLGTELVSMVVWDGQAGDGAGGTQSRVEQWRRHGRRWEHIDPTGLIETAGVSRDAGATPSRPGGSPGTAAPTPHQRVMAMLFADAVGFSKLTEAAIPAFVDHFLGSIGQLAARSRHAPVFRNTWGDGLFFVFDSVEDAGAFALELSETLDALDRPGLGLPETLDLRIGLHAGPVYVITDPVTGTTNYVGAHVSRAARIEPITPPGHAYASQAFAALAAAQVAAPTAAKGFACRYVGQVPLAKHYGTFAMYHVQRPDTAL